MKSVPLKTNKLLTYRCGCHGNLVTIAMGYFAYVYCLIKRLIADMNSIQLRRKELFTYHYGCHRNLIVIATRYLADSYCPNKR